MNKVYSFVIPFLSDGAININEFADLLKALFRNEKGKPYPIDQSLCNELFMIFNQAGVRAEFHEVKNSSFVQSL